MAEHTPGDWFAGKLRLDSNGISQSLTIGTFEADEHYEDTIAEVWHGNHDAEANARLIAKAWLIPELVEALKDAIRVCSCCGGTGKVRTHPDETEVGCSPGSSAMPCPNCTDWRAVLARAKEPAP